MAEGESYPTEFNSEKILWKRQVPPGKSSPVLTGPHIFLTAQQNGKLMVLCFDRLTGKIVWERSITPSRDEFQHTLNSAASSTPVTDGENVYAFFGNFGLVSYSPKGEERWRTPLGPFSSVWGMAASPILASGNVVLVLDGFGESLIAAFDQKTGKQKWKATRLPFALNYSTPILRRASTGQEQIVIAGPGQIMAYDAGSGEQRWSADIPGAASIIASLAVGTGVVYSLTYSLEGVPSFDEQLKNLDKDGDGNIGRDEFGTGLNARALEVFGTMHGNRDGTIDRQEWSSIWSQWVGKPVVTAVRLGETSNGTAARSQTAWSYFRNIPRVPSPLLKDGILYFVNNGGILTALDADTGEARKTGRLTGALDNYFSSPVSAAGKLYFTSESGKIAVVKAGTAWELLAVNDLGEECYATPALSAGQIFVRTGQSLLCIGRRRDDAAVGSRLKRQ